MDINKILKADYLDILFEGRNKQYGGYDLRKKYKRRAAIAALISALSICGLFASTLYEKKLEPTPEPPVIKDVKLAAPPPLDEHKPPPPPPTQPPPPVKPTVKFTPPVIKKNEEVKKDEQPEPPKPTENKVVGPTNVKGSDDPNSMDPGLAPSGNGKGPVEAPAAVDDKPFLAVEQPPEFPGGTAAMYKYIQDHLRYPQQAREESIQGKVYLRFVVERDGTVDNIEIQRDPGGGCGKEADRVVRSMPKWKAGKQNGQAVRVFFTLPVNFKLGDQ